MIRVALMLSIASICLAATLHVPGDYPTIQEAIAAAQDGDTVLVGPGSYGGPISFRGKNIVVKSEYGPGPTDIHCTFFGSSVVYITNGEDSTAVLEGFTLFNDRGGMAGLRSRERDFAGGGICIDSASPVVRGNVIKNSEAQGGVEYTATAPPR